EGIRPTLGRFDRVRVRLSRRSVLQHVHVARGDAELDVLDGEREARRHAFVFRRGHARAPVKPRIARATMATLFLMCGLPGSGKTTLAKAIERERRALRLTPDDWIEALRLDPYDEAMRARIEKQLWNTAAFALEHGVDVVLDFGVWQRRERDEF